MTGEFCPIQCVEDHKHHWSSGRVSQACPCGTCRAGQVAAEESGTMSKRQAAECGNYRLHGSAVTCPHCGFRGPVDRSARLDILTDAEVRNLPLDERAYFALVEAFGQDEDAAQSALDAVLPFMRLAWDHGYSDGYWDEHSDPGGKPKSPNPFRVIPPARSKRP